MYIFFFLASHIGILVSNQNYSCQSIIKYRPEEMVATSQEKKKKKRLILYDYLFHEENT